MIICLSTKGYCFQEQCANVLPIVFLLFCDLKILKQGIEMQIFPKRVVEILKKKGEPPRQVTFNLGRSHNLSRTQINAGGQYGATIRVTSWLKSGLQFLDRYGTHQESTSRRSEQVYLPSDSRLEWPGEGPLFELDLNKCWAKM